MSPKPEFLANYYTEEEEAQALGVVARTLRNWRREKHGPPFVKIANRIYYLKSSTEAWLRSQERAAAA